MVLDYKVLAHVNHIPRFASRCVGRAPQAGALLLGLIIALAGTDAAAASTEADKLRAELEALKIENARQAERMRVLEERIRALETTCGRRSSFGLRRAPPKRWLPRTERDSW